VTAVSGSHSNSATAHATYSGSTYDSLPSTATYATTGLALEKSVAEGYFSAADDVLHYSYLITNSGSAPLAGPVSISDDQSSDEACPAVSTVGDLDDFLDPGESITCTATYTVAAGDVTAGSVTNTASAEADGVTSNTDTQTVYVFLPQLSVSKSNDAGGNGSLGVSFSWTLTLANIGPVSATFADGQTITSDPLPSGATYGSATPGDFTNITNSGNISCSIDGSNVLTCAASGGSVTVGASTGSFTVTIDTTPAATGSLANTATVDPDDVIIEADEADNTGSDTVSVTAPGLTATKTNDAGGTLLLGGSFSWTIQVSSATGGSTGTATFASGEVVLRDNLPTGPSYGSVTITDGATAPGGSGSLNCSIASDTLTCSASGGSVTLPPSASFSASFSVTPTSAGDLTNPSSGVGDVCQVDPDGLISESDESNNDCADTVAVTSIAPPTIAKSFSPAAIAVGDTSTLTFTLANPSGNTVALTGMDFSDTYPAGVQNDSPLTTTNTCGGGLTATAGGNSIVLSGGSIPVDGTCTVTVVVTGTTAGTKDNTSGNVTSTNGGTGNTASDTLTVSEATFADPAVTKTLDPASAQVGDTVTFTLVVTNEGTADATGVGVTDTIPSFLDIASVSVSPVGPTVTTTGNTITINVGTVTPSDVFTVTITTIVNNLGEPPGGTNQADLTSGSIDPDPANNTDSVSLAIVAASGLGAPETGFAPNRQTTLPVQPETEAYENYGDLWLEIPSIGVEASILGVPLGPNGWDVTWLSDQAGYLAGTAFPTWTGNSVITGHATLPSGSAGPFARIQKLRYGDQIIVHAWGYRYNYEVREASLVRPSSPSIFRHEERAWVSLITCAGYDDAAGTYRWRQLVRAVLVRVETTNAIPAGGPRPARSK